MAGLSEALKVAQTTRNHFNYWVRAKLLSTTFAPTDPGVARTLSRENVLELAFMSAAVEIGMTPRNAASMVGNWLDKERRGHLNKFHVQRLGKGNWVVMYEDDTFETISRVLGRAVGQQADGPERATVFSVVDLHEIVRRVDELFEGVSQ